MNSKKCKRIRKILGNSWRDQRYIVSSLHPKANVPPVPEGLSISHHNIRVGADGWFPVVNPIMLHPECGRAQYKRLKKYFTKGGINAAILQ